MGRSRVEAEKQEHFLLAFERHRITCEYILLALHLYVTRSGWLKAQSSSYPHQQRCVGSLLAPPSSRRVSMTQRLWLCYPAHGEPAPVRSRSQSRCQFFFLPLLQPKDD